jgi:hypothetical protein
MRKMEKWRVRNLKDRKMDHKKIMPVEIECDPAEQFPLETKHKFEATKVYLMTDGEGREDAIVICPTHLLPIPVELVRRRLQSGDGKPPVT